MKRIDNYRLLLYEKHTSSISIRKSDRKGGNVKRKSVFILMVLVSAFGLAGCTEEKKAAAPPPPPEVEVAEVIQKDVPVYRSGWPPWTAW